MHGFNKGEGFVALLAQVVYQMPRFPWSCACGAEVVGSLNTFSPQLSVQRWSFEDIMSCRTRLPMSCRTGPLPSVRQDNGVVY
jgi:hypothetical protein